MTVTANKMNGCVGSIRRERPVSLPLDDGACFCNSRHYSDLPDFLKSFHSQEDEIYRGNVGTELYWAGGVVGTRWSGRKANDGRGNPQRRFGRARPEPSGEALPSRFESGPAQNIHKAAGGPFGIAGGLFLWRLGVSSSSSSSSGIGFFGLLAIVFITLKLLGKIDWSWWWVLSPIWGGAAIVIFLIVIVIFLIVTVGGALLFFDRR